MLVWPGGWEPSLSQTVRSMGSCAMNCLVCSGGLLGGEVCCLGGNSGWGCGLWRITEPAPSSQPFPCSHSVSPAPSPAGPCSSPLCALSALFLIVPVFYFSHLCVLEHAVFVVWVDSLRLHTHVCECGFKAGLTGMDFTAHTSWFWKKERQTVRGRISEVGNILI